MIKNSNSSRLFTLVAKGTKDILFLMPSCSNSGYFRRIGFRQGGHASHLLRIRQVTDKNTDEAVTIEADEAVVVIVWVNEAVVVIVEVDEAVIVIVEVD
jgi:hypothetical protein